jgi:hypothetical protein
LRVILSSSQFLRNRFSQACDVPDLYPLGETDPSGFDRDQVVRATSRLADVGGRADQLEIASKDAKHVIDDNEAAARDIVRLFTDGWTTQQAREQAAIIINRPAENCPDVSAEDRGEWRSDPAQRRRHMRLPHFRCWPATVLAGVTRSVSAVWGAAAKPSPTGNALRRF